MSEIGEMFAATKEQRKHESKCRKRNNMNGSIAMLGENGINYVSKNGGVHLVIEHNYHTVDFWPSTGKFAFRTDFAGAKKYYRGVRLLIKMVGGDYTTEQRQAIKPDCIK